MPFDPAVVVQDVRWLADVVGPRPHGSPGERAAADFVRDRLAAIGWEPRAFGQPPTWLGCRGTPRRLFLAHVDSVVGSPGAVDNAAGVAALLELARTTAATDLCVGFPVGEEERFVGSTLLADVVDPSLVVALDLTGHGRLSVTGLGPAWGTDELTWLQEAVTVDSPWGYRIVSRAFPWAERSDHAPFAQRGALALHLLGRGEHGVFPRYHQSTDRDVEPEALRDLGHALEGLATRPLPRRSTSPGPAIPLGQHLWPAWATWLALGASVLVATSALARRLWTAGLASWSEVVSEQLRSLGLGVVRLGAAALGTHAVLALGAPTSTEERTAAAVMGVPATGWWTLAPWAFGLGWLAWALADPMLAALPRGAGPSGRPPWAWGHSLACATMAVGTSWLVDPTLGVAYALATPLARLHPRWCLGPALYFTRPDALRELAFHGMLPPEWWWCLWALAWPASGRYRTAHVHATTTPVGRGRAPLRVPGPEAPRAPG